ncbi:MAG: hypothetical protein Q8S09_07310 [Hyphomonas sp.]|nr:hypothetical protein [Hyphomonas sp.]MDP3459066.1 hypothetical protein [Hyphomonas sp.]
MPDTPETKPAAPEPGKAPDKAPGARPPLPAEKQAVLTDMVGDLVPGRIVRGPAPEVSALIAAGKARLASAVDLGVAGGRTVRLPKQRR